MKHRFILSILAGVLLALPLSSAFADGKAVFNKTCRMCHATGVAGAPKLGDKAAWAPRAKKGLDTLVQHAIKGFKGSKGLMPARGGNPSLSDAEVKAAVQYMLDQAK